MTMHTCSICNIKFEAESPAILFVNRFGFKRALCEECENLLDLATLSADDEEKKHAEDALMERASAMKDPDAMDALRGVLAGETSAEVTEEDLEAEKEWKENEEEENEEEPKSLWIDYLLPIAAGVLFAAFVFWFFFFR